MTASTLDDERSTRIARGTARRILAAAAVVLDEPGPQEDELTAAAQALERMVNRLADRHEPSLAWLLLTVVAGAYPDAADVRFLVRASELADERETTLALLDRALPIAARHGTADRAVRVVRGVLVEVDGCARSDFHNGIQRVARETVRAWRTEHELTLLAWTDTAGITRDLTALEHRRAGAWGATQEEAGVLLDLGRDGDDTEDDDGATSERSGGERRPEAATTDLVVPWQATVVLAEVPLADRCPPLAALAELSGNQVVAIGYDAIPVVSADLRPLGEANAFAAYLTVVKHSRRVAGISRSATDEFAGFAHALASQGLAGPAVHEVQLPADVPPPPPDTRWRPPAVPQVLCVGRLEPHKNHAAVLHAAERLWREGLVFELTVVGADGWNTDVVGRQLEALRRAGRPVRRPGAVSDDEMWRLVREASFSVFVSLHEGFGLPVAESLACGTPVITTRYGSQAEIAEQGGCLTVDPRDDDDLTEAIRTLLTDEETYQRLRAEAAALVGRTWKDYADELWRTLVGGEPS